jgi:hypothetical protein
MTAQKKAQGAKVLVDGAVSDGKGGHYPKGHALGTIAADTLASLKAKGLAA